MRHKLRLGLIGCGGFGGTIGSYFLNLADITALCDLDSKATAATARQLSLDVPRYVDYRRMLEKAQLDAVIIATINAVHADITVAAAEAGLHVFCEKAMARTVPECWQMVRACRKNNVRLMIGHKRRLRPPWARMIELTDDSLLGDVLSVTVAQYADLRPYNFSDNWWGDPELSGGHFATHGVHVIDWFAALCGRATKVSAYFGPQHKHAYKYPDIIHATYQFRSGALASVSSGMSFPLHEYRESQTPWAQCRHGGFKLVPCIDHIDLYWQRGDSRDIHHERFDDLGFEHAFQLEAVDFVRWVTEDRKPCLTWIEGLRCVEMMEAAYRSAEKGGEVIELPLYPELETENEANDPLPRSDVEGEKDCNGDQTV